MSSFFDISELALALRRMPDGASPSSLAAELQMTESDATRLAQHAEELGAVALTDDRLVTLTPVGNSLGGAMEEHLAVIEPRVLASFEPYTSYVPERWWPEKTAVSTD